MTIVLMSCFRNMAHRLPVYFRQVEVLRSALETRGDALRLISIEGDSVDDTRARLLQFADVLQLDMDLVVREHGGPNHGSVVHPQRFKQLAFVVNGGFERVRDTDDAVIYVESDLLWQPPAFLNCLAQLRPGVDIISPPVFTQEGAFYDIWGYRAPNGRSFGPLPPYWTGLNQGGLTEMYSVGSCLVVRGDVARVTRLTPELALVGFCEHARKLGFHVFTDWRERIAHP